MRLFNLKSIVALASILLINILVSSSLFAESLDPSYAINITKSYGSVRAPNDVDEFLGEDTWSASHIIHLDNGLYVYKSSRWKYESNAKQEAKKAYSGKINLLAPTSDNKNFAFIQQGSEYAYSITFVYVDEDYKFRKLPKILSITEQIEVIRHWFSVERNYRYVLGLSDGTIWQTKKRSSPWTNIWETNSRLLKVGNSASPCFINIDAVLKESAHTSVESKHYLADIELLP